MYKRTAVAVAVICVLAGGCGTSQGSVAPSTSTRSMIPRPIVERELPGLLLSPEQVGAAVGSVGMTVTRTQTSMSDHSATMEPRECLAVDGAAEALVYADTGYWAARDQTLTDGDDFAHYVKQAVVLYPTIEHASAFFDASAEQWPACRDYSHTQSGTQWSAAGPISNADGVLSTVATQHDAGNPGWGCGRALALENNILVDVNTCSANPADTAVKIASQIADNVAARW